MSGALVPPVPLDVHALREAQFPISRRLSYLDHASFGPPARACVEAVARCWRELSEGTRMPVPWAAELDRVRSQVARLIGCGPEDVAFLKSTAEAMGLVALGLDWRPGDEVVAYERSFPAGVLPWLNLAHLGVRVRFVRDGGRHRFDAADVEALMGERTRAVCLELVNFGNGFRTPVEQVAELCRRRGAWLLVDATQAAGVLPVDVRSLGCHLVAAHAYKFLAAGYGTALCYVAPDLRRHLRVPEPGWKSRWPGPPLTDYEHLEFPEVARRFEPSIPDVAGIVGLGASLDLLAGLGPAAVQGAVLRLADAAAAGLGAIGFRVVSSLRDGERSAILSLEREGTDPAALEAALLEAGVVCAVREGRVRLSFHCWNDEGDLDRLLETLRLLDAPR